LDESEGEHEDGEDHEEGDYAAVRPVVSAATPLESEEEAGE
jgi:hypothetical protein